MPRVFLAVFFAILLAASDNDGAGLAGGFNPGSFGSSSRNIYNDAARNSGDNQPERGTSQEHDSNDPQAGRAADQD